MFLATLFMNVLVILYKPIVIVVAIAFLMLFCFVFAFFFALFVGLEKIITFPCYIKN